MLCYAAWLRSAMSPGVMRRVRVRVVCRCTASVKHRCEDVFLRPAWCSFRKAGVRTVDIWAGADMMFA